jgi:primosomal protein N' (replication factor Y) (superfamily II helicase)
MYPEKSIARADRDEIHSRETLEDLIERMENHKIDILVGTQMIAKGLDFPKLTLVGLVLADVGFNMPDFRSTERSFQLLTQVSGRSGRHVADGGSVVIQTYNPEYPSLPFAKTADFVGFANQELVSRGELNYPPFGKLATLKIIAANKDLGITAADQITARAHALIQSFAAYQIIQVLGPAAAPLAKLRGKFRFHLLLKANSPHLLSKFCRQLLADKSWILPGTKVQVDIDPLNLL